MLRVHLQSAYFPKETNSKLARTVRQNCAFLALESAECLIQNGDISRGILQLKIALNYSRSYRVIQSASRILLLNCTLSLFRKMVTLRGYKKSAEI